MGHNTENKLKTAFENAVPDVLDSILADLPCDEKKAEPVKKRRVPYRKLLSIAAMLVIIIGSIFGIYKYHDITNVNSTVFLDVNPSIEIKANSSEKVLSVVSKNSDGDKIIEGMNFSDTNLDLAVNAIVSSMQKHGYINDVSNSILISVTSKNAEKSSELRSRLAKDVENQLCTNGFSPAVISQIVDNSSIEELSEKHGITPGKVQLIQKIVCADGSYSFDDLTALSINELCIIAVEHGITPADIELIGHPSDKAYIGKDNALDVALGHVNLDTADSVKAELTLKDGVMVYEINLNYSGNDYGFTINASDGSVVIFENNDRKENSEVIPPSYDNTTSAIVTTPAETEAPSSETQSTTKKPDTTTETKKTPVADTEPPAPDKPESLPVKFTPEDARLIASRHAKLNENTKNVVDFTCTSYVDNGTPLYKIRFYSTNFRKNNGTRFDYIISAYSGTVISSKETDSPYYIPSSREVFVPYLRTASSGNTASYTYYEYSGYSLSYITSGLDLTSTPMCVNSSDGCILKFDSKSDIDILLKMIEDANLTAQGMDGYEARAFISDLSRYSEDFFTKKRLYLVPVVTDIGISDLGVHLYFDDYENRLSFNVNVRYRNKDYNLATYTFFLVETEKSIFPESTAEMYYIGYLEDANKADVTKKYHMNAYLNETK